MNKILLTSIAALAMLSACTKEDQLKGDYSASPVRAYAPAIDYDESFFESFDQNMSTRTAIDFASGSLLTYWSAGDKVGIFPTTTGTFTDGSTSQLPFVVAGGENATLSPFDGGGFGLIEGELYAASYPYGPSNDNRSAINYDYTYLVNEATAIVPGDADFVNKYDYMKADPVEATPEDYTQFNFDRVGAVVRFDIRYTAEGLYDKLLVTALNRETKKLTPIITYATGDLTQYNRRRDASRPTSWLSATSPVAGNTTECISFVTCNSTQRNSSVKLTAEQIADPKQNYRQFYWIMFPQDLSATDYVVYAHNKVDGSWYAGSTAAKNQKADVAYAYKFTLNQKYGGSNAYLPDFFNQHDSESYIMMNQWWIYISLLSTDVDIIVN